MKNKVRGENDLIEKSKTNRKESSHATLSSSDTTLENLPPK